MKAINLILFFGFFIASAFSNIKWKNKSNDALITNDKNSGQINDFVMLTNKVADCVLVVGEKNVEIFAHKDILIKSSKYFELAFKSDWVKLKSDGDAKNEKQILSLPEIQKQHMMLVLTYIYTGSTDGIVNDLMAPVYLEANYLQLQKDGKADKEFFEICENKVNVANAFEMFKAGFILDKITFAKTCLYILNVGILKASRKELSTLSLEMLHQIIISYHRIISNTDLWQFVEKYAKVILQQDESYEDSTQVIVRFLRKYNDLSFQFNPNKHFKILKSLVNATIDSVTKALIKSLFKTFLSNEPVKPLFPIATSVSLNLVQFYPLMDKVSEMITKIDPKFIGKTIRWKTLFKSSEHGYWDNSDKFHEKCENMGATITLLKVANFVIAAYNSDDWKTPEVNRAEGVETINEYGFIAFLENNQIKMFHRNMLEKGGAVSKNGFGPVFGTLRAVDFKTSSDLIVESAYYKVNLGNSYVNRENPSSDIGIALPQNIQDGYEVFEIEVI